MADRPPPPPPPRPGGPRASRPGEDDWRELEREVNAYWRSERLSEALQRLSAAEREVIELRFVEEWELAVIAEVTGRTPADVRRLIASALERLRENLRA